MEKLDAATAVLTQIVEHHLDYDGPLEEFDLIENVDEDIATNFINDVEETFLGQIDASGKVFEDIWTGATLKDVLDIVVNSWDGVTLEGVADGEWLAPEMR